MKMDLHMSKALSSKEIDLAASKCEMIGSITQTVSQLYF